MKTTSGPILPTRTAIPSLLSPVARSIAGVLGLACAFEPLHATTRFVQNCDDSGPGSLRATISGADSYDGIDLSQLQCSTISLTSGEIVVSQTGMFILGPGASKLSISANYNSRIFKHTGQGSFSILDVTLTQGKYAPGNASPAGGCIYSAGGVGLIDSVVDTCVAQSGAGYFALGGAVFAGSVSMTRSTITGAVAQGGSTSSGGAVYSTGDLYMKNSTLSGNTAMKGQNNSTGGGATALGVAKVYYSTIDANEASRGGGIYAGNGLILQDSTVSGNQAIVGGGVVARNASAIRIYNSTVAFNSASANAGGVYSSGNTTMISSLVAKNSLTPGQSPSSVADLFVNLTKSLSGYGNLVMDSNQFLQGTLTADPHLAPLAWRGGYTRTHAPNEGSPVIDHGSNPHNLEYDQRFGYGFDANPRQWGGATDIGAYERRAFDDQLFYDGFN